MKYTCFSAFTTSSLSRCTFSKPKAADGSFSEAKGAGVKKLKNLGIF
jgi:hypothetical protein